RAPFGCRDPVRRRVLAGARTAPWWPERRGVRVMPEPSKLDLYQTITDRIVAALESGPDKVSLPWHRTGACSILPRNAFTGHAYNGINVLSLCATAEERQYPRSLWATYRQWLGLDAQ